MAEPVRKPPPDVDGEAVAILKRIEPLLGEVLAEQKRQTELNTAILGRLGKSEAFQERHGEALDELRGKVSQFPTYWQTLSAIVTIMAAGVALTA